MTHITLVNIFIACLLLVLNVMEVRSLQTRFCTIDTRPHPRGVCGSTLADRLQALCVSDRIKRDAAEELSDPFQGKALNKPIALSFLTKREPGYNIICECCKNFCNINEMMAYC